MKVWLFVLALAVGALLRLLLLDLRPMHTDEAVHAVKFGSLLETHRYRYDRFEYHGPTLYYATLIPARVSARWWYPELKESTLRVVPAACGIILIALLALFRDLGRGPVTMAALFTAVSPAFVFYSRYYIQEMLLVAFTLGAIASVYLMLTTRLPVWSIVAGIFAGLMHATKETSLIAFGVSGISLALTWIWSRGNLYPRPAINARDVVLFIVSACAVSIAFYSSFGTNWGGVADSILAYENYFTRAGAPVGHRQPWDYYFRLLGWWKRGAAPVWTEGVILLFAVPGIIRALRRSPETRLYNPISIFLAFYAILMWVIYSSIPYKTPWSILGAYHGVVIMAGIGAAQFLGWSARGWFRGPATVLVAAGIAYLAWQSYRASFVLFDDPSSPYVYSQPQRSVKEIARKVREVATASGAGDSLTVQVIYPKDDYWPLPWELRSFPHVGWWNMMSEEFTPAPVILASPEVDEELLRQIYEGQRPGKGVLYVPLFDEPMYLRPGREIRGYVTLELLEKSRHAAGK
jgi:uncharacterized protein (TIGR03663 family)